MAFPKLEDPIAKVPNRYLLVSLAAKRSRQLNRGAPMLVESKRKKCTSVALEEIAAGKVMYRVSEADAPKVLPLTPGGPGQGA